MGRRMAMNLGLMSMLLGFEGIGGTKSYTQGAGSGKGKKKPVQNPAGTKLAKKLEIRR